jgi:hypothetical protein
VDNRTFKRLLYEVLDHAPAHDDITLFFRRFRAELDRRGLTLRGITTDGSPLKLGIEPRRSISVWILTAA